MRRKGNTRNKVIIWFLSIFLVLSLSIIGLSIFFEQVPDKTTDFVLKKIKGDSILLLPSRESLIDSLDSKDKIIDSLKIELKKYEKLKTHKRALVNVESGTLNMRDKPQLASSIVAKIPDSSYVDVMYFDTKYYYLNGERGRWCKVKYADTTGWVWESFIRIQKK